MARNKRTGNRIAALLGIGLILALLQVGHALQGSKALIPSVDELLRTLWDMLGREKTYTRIGVTLLHVVKSVALSSVIGIALGMAEGLVPYLHALLRPLQSLFRSIPVILLGIIMLMVTRFSKEWMPVLTGCLVLVPLISEAAYEGCVRIDTSLTDVYRLDSRTTPRIILRVYLPLISGYIRQAFVNACGMGLKVVVTAEYLVQTADSLGTAIHNQLDSLNYAELFAYALIMVLLVLVLTGIPALVMRLMEMQKKKEITNG